MGVLSCWRALLVVRDLKSSANVSLTAALFSSFSSATHEASNHTNGVSEQRLRGTFFFLKKNLSFAACSLLLMAQLVRHHLLFYSLVVAITRLGGTTCCFRDRGDGVQFSCRCRRWWHWRQLSCLLFVQESFKPHKLSRLQAFHRYIRARESPWWTH
jgi:hypothetical protein